MIMHTSCLTSIHEAVPFLIVPDVITVTRLYFRRLGTVGLIDTFTLTRADAEHHVLGTQSFSFPTDTLAIDLTGLSLSLTPGVIWCGSSTIFTELGGSDPSTTTVGISLEFQHA